MSERCSVCDILLSSLGEEGCDQCGLVYDPLMPDRHEELDFNTESVDRYGPIPDTESELTDSLGNQITASWDADDL